MWIRKCLDPLDFKIARTQVITSFACLKFKSILPLPNLLYNIQKSSITANLQGYRFRIYLVDVRELFTKP